MNPFGLQIYLRDSRTIQKTTVYSIHSLVLILPFFVVVVVVVVYVVVVVR